MRAQYYQQFDADHSLEVPGEGYGGWKSVEIDPGSAALVVMHAWDCGTLEQYPGWYRAVEYIPRSQEICRTVFPPLLGACRRRKNPASSLQECHEEEANPAERARRVIVDFHGFSTAEAA